MFKYFQSSTWSNALNYSGILQKDRQARELGQGGWGKWMERGWKSAFFFLSWDGWKHLWYFPVLGQAHAPHTETHSAVAFWPCQRMWHFRGTVSVCLQARTLQRNGDRLLHCPYFIYKFPKHLSHKVMWHWSPQHQDVTRLTRTIFTYLLMIYNLQKWLLNIVWLKYKCL